MTLIALLFAACAPTDHGVSNLVLTHSPHALGVATITWDSDQTGDGYVEVSSPNGKIHTPLTSNDTTHHSVEVRGLPLGQFITYTVHTTTSDDTLSSTPRTLTVPNTESLSVAKPQLVSSTPERAMTDGYFLVGLRTLDGLATPAILDRYGDIVWAPTASLMSITAANVTDDGRILAMQNVMGADGESIITTTLDGQTTQSTRPFNGHHDALVINDELLAIGFEHGLTEIDGLAVDVGSDTIVSVPIGGTADDTTTIFSFKDSYAAPWHPCDHFDEDAYNMTGVRDFTHSNSLVAFDDHLYLMSLHLDMILKIDGPNIVWQFGGDLNDFTLKNPDNWFDHGHFSDVWNGGLLVFDNSSHRKPNVSRVIEYALDESTMTAEAVWVYDHPNGQHASFLGDAKRLPNGNTLIAWSTTGELTEVTPDGEIVWKVVVPNGDSIIRASFIPDLYNPVK